MTNPLPFLVAGIVAGSVYGMAAMGLALSYRLSRVVNFALGAVAILCASSYWQLHVAWGWPAWASVIVAIGVLPAGMALAAERLLFQRLTDASVFARTSATVGLLLVCFGLTVTVWEGKAVEVPSLFPAATVDLPGVIVSGDQIGIFVTVAALALAVFFFVRHTRLGLDLRAVVDNRGLAGIRGVDTRRVSRIAWIISFVFAAISGLLLAPLYGSNPLLLTLVLVYSLVALVLGGMVSLPLTLCGGLLVGLTDALALGYLPEGELASRVRGMVPFGLLFLVIIIRSGRTRALAAGEGRSSFLADLGGVGRSQLGPVGIAVTLLAAGVVVMVGGDYWSYLFAAGIGYAIIFLSYTAFTSLTGMVSLAQAAFAGLGAFITATMAHGSCSASGVDLTVSGHCLYGPVRLPWILAVLAGGVGAAFMGAVLAIPTVRLRGIYLALATIGFAQLAEAVLFRYERFTGGLSGRQVPRPVGFEGDTAYFMLALGVFLVLGRIVGSVRRSTIGRELQAQLGSETGALSVGVRPESGRLLAFALAAGIAGIGGGVFVTVAGRAATDTWNLINALLWLSVAAIGGVGSPWGALVGGVLLGLMPEIIRHYPGVGQVQMLLFGGVALFFLRRPGGLVGLARQGASTCRSVSRYERARNREGISLPALAAGARAPTGNKEM